MVRNLWDLVLTMTKISLNKKEHTKVNKHWWRLFQFYEPLLDKEWKLTLHKEKLYNDEMDNLSNKELMEFFK